MTKPRFQSIPKLLTETDRATMTEWHFVPGAETGRHRHAHDYVVVVLTAGKLMQETANGEIVTEPHFCNRSESPRPYFPTA